MSPHPHLHPRNVILVIIPCLPCVTTVSLIQFGMPLDLVSIHLNPASLHCSSSCYHIAACVCRLSFSVQRAPHYVCIMVPYHNMRANCGCPDTWLHMGVASGYGKHISSHMDLEADGMGMHCCVYLLLKPLSHQLTDGSVVSTKQSHKRIMCS